MTQELELNIDYDALNADIAKEKERMELSWAKQMWIEEAAIMFNDLSLSFDQKWYADIINKTVVKLKKEIRASSEFEMPMCSIYGIMMHWYNEIQWEQLERIKPLLPKEINFEIDESVVYNGTVRWARLLMKELESRMKKIAVAEKSLDTLSRRNSTEHMYINLITNLARAYQSREMIDQVLDWFTFFEISNG